MTVCKSCEELCDGLGPYCYDCYYENLENEDKEKELAEERRNYDEYMDRDEDWYYED